MEVSVSMVESFCGSPPNLSSTKSLVLKPAAGRLSPAKHGGPPHPDAVVRQSLANKTM